VLTGKLDIRGIAAQLPDGSAAAEAAPDEPLEGIETEEIEA
jgi:hypothetical protein